MVSKKFITLKGRRRTAKSLYVKEHDITKGYGRWTEAELKVLRTMMREKISKFEFKKDLSDSLQVLEQAKTDKQVIWSLSTDLKHAKYNEFGVAETRISTYNNPELQEWCEKKLGFVPARLIIGGPRSRIKLGASKNKFFFNTLDEYIDNNKGRVFAKRLNEAMNK